MLCSILPPPPLKPRGQFIFFRDYSDEERKSHAEAQEREHGGLFLNALEASETGLS